MDDELTRALSEVQAVLAQLEGLAMTLARIAPVRTQMEQTAYELWFRTTEYAAKLRLTRAMLDKSLEK